jgi:predicted permease
VTDLRFALRQLLKNPGFTAVAVLTLALGIGANATIFSIINSILVKPLRVTRPEEIVGVYQHDRDNADSFHLFSYPDFVDLRATPDSAFAELFAFGRASVAVRDGLIKETPANIVSANYFAALGVAPALGRVFVAEEETSGAPVTVLTHAFWQKLGGDPGIIGTTLKLARGDVTVIGVMPRDFTGAQLLAPALYLPLGTPESLLSGAGEPAPRRLENRADHRFMLMGRLKPGLTLAKVGGALEVMSQRFAIPDPGEPKARTLLVTEPSRFNFSDGPSRNKKGLSQMAGFAFGLSALVLVIACLNLANMMLARGTARRKEVAVRLALGAGRRRILTQLLTEGLLLALMGGVAGLLVSMGATRILSSLIYSGAGMPADFPVFDLSPDGRALLVLLALSGLATVFFALGPAWSLARLEFNADLKQHSGEDVRGGRFGMRDILAVGQMAFTLALLVVAALFCRSAINAYDANPGFEMGAHFFVALDPKLIGETDTRAWTLNRSATERLAALPGVESVSSALYIPFGGSLGACDIQLGGAPSAADANASPAEGRPVSAAYNVVGANYFHTLGITLLRGREFERREEETNSAQPVAIISQALAEQFWPGADPLGRTIQFPSRDPKFAPKRMTVVGIVPAVQRRLFKDELPAAVYIPLGQEFHPDFKLHVRVAPGVDPAPLMATARAELHRLDAGVPLTEIKTLVAMHRDGPDVRVMRLGSVLFGAFGGLAMLLSSLGIYGLKSYSVSRRTREIGIRMALGANPRHVVGLILRESAWLAGLGLGLGLMLAFAVGKLTANFLYHVPATDPVTFMIVPPLLLAVALFACWLPARRAARVNPMVALRSE